MVHGGLWAILVNSINWILHKMKQCPFGIECESCRFFTPWHMVNDKGEEKFEDRCGFEILFAEIPKFRGSVDGVQSAVNEARNRSMETKNVVNGFIAGMIGLATQKAIEK